MTDHATDGSEHDAVSVFDSARAAVKLAEDALRDELKSIDVHRKALDKREAAIRERLGQSAAKRGRKAKEKDPDARASSKRGPGLNPAVKLESKAPVAAGTGE